MFRKIYTEANESIHGDRAIIDKAFEMAQKPEAKKSNILKYSFIGTAAAAVLVAGAVFVNYSLVKLPVEDIFVAEPTEQREDTDAAPVIQEALPNEDLPTEALKSKELPKAKKPSSVNDAENTPKNAVPQSGHANEKAPENTAPQSGYANENADDAADTPEDEKQTESAVPEPESQGAGMYAAQHGRSADADDGGEDNWKDTAAVFGVMTMADMSEDTNMNAVSYTPEEYFNYIGIDFSKLSLPNGLVFDIKESYTLSMAQNGEITGDTAVFTAFNDECEISVMTSKIDDVQWAIDTYEKKSDNMSMFDDGSFVTVYAKKGDVSLTVFFEGISEEEITAFMEQILK